MTAEPIFEIWSDEREIVYTWRGHEAIAVIRYRTSSDQRPGQLIWVVTQIGPAERTAIRWCDEMVRRWVKEQCSTGVRFTEREARYLEGE